MYEIIYDYEDEKNIRETFEGDWTALQEYITKMKENGCYNIDAASIYQGIEPEKQECSDTNPSGECDNDDPENSQGMGVHAFI